MLAVVTLFIISLIIFVGVEALPGDMATAYLGQFATPESLKALREEFDLAAPAHERYFNWLGNAIRGDLGESYARHKPVSELIGYRFRNTVVLSTAATLVGVPLAIVLGILAGLTRDKWPDVTVSTVSIAGMTLPGFVTATVLIFIFAIRLEWFPAVTLVSTDAPVSDLLPNIVLPVITLTIIMVAHILRLVRTNMIDVMNSDYVQMAQLKGVPSRRIVFGHALPNAMLPTINNRSSNYHLVAGRRGDYRDRIQLPRHREAHGRRHRRQGSGVSPRHRSHPRDCCDRCKFSRRFAYSRSQSSITDGTGALDRFE